MATTMRTILNDSVICNDSLLLFAAKYYNNPHCVTLDEFNSDLLIPTNIKKLFRRYKENNDLQERLILNHFISFFNVFDSPAACRILFYRIQDEYYVYLKTVLYFLKRHPATININNEIIDINKIKIDQDLLLRLTEI